MIDDESELFLDLLSIGHGHLERKKGIDIHKDNLNIMIKLTDHFLTTLEKNPLEKGALALSPRLSLYHLTYYAKNDD